MPDNTPFFIVGAGRSGTTLLRLILAGHSRLHIPPETQYIVPLVQTLPLTGQLNPAQIAQALAIMVENYRWPDLGIPPDDLQRQACGIQNPRLVDIIDIVYQTHLLRARKTRFGDKTPVYIDIIPQLSVLYPGAKFIHLIRDGRDVAISRIDVGWERYYERSKFEWTHAMAKRREHTNQPIAGQILEVRYEDLVRDLRSTVQRVCSFLTEDFEPAMLDWRPLIDLVPERERHIHGRLARPVSRDDVAVWQRRLSAPECFAIEACLYRDLEELGYQLKFSKPAWRPFLQVTGALMHATAPLLQRSAAALKRRKLLPRHIVI
jgi:hypothetical protein